MVKDKAWWNHPSRAGRKLLEDTYYKVFSLIPRDGEIWTKDLKEKAKESGIAWDTLYRYLEKLIEAKQVERRVDTSVWPNQVYYSRAKTDFFFMDRESYERCITWREMFPKAAARFKGDKFSKFFLTPKALKIEFFELVRMFYFIMSYAIEKFESEEERRVAIDTMTSLYFKPWLERMKLWVEAGPKDELDKAIEPFNKAFYELVGVKDESELVKREVEFHRVVKEMDEAITAFLDKYRGEGWTKKTLTDNPDLFYQEFKKLTKSHLKEWIKFREQFTRAPHSRGEEEKGGEKN